MKLLALSAGALLLAIAKHVDAGAVVIGKNSPLSSVSVDEAKRVFIGREALVNGLPIIVVYQKNETVRTDFETKVLEKTGADLTAYWTKQLFTGKVTTAPLEVSSDAEVRAKVANNPGAIGYVSDAGVDATVKVLFRY